MILPLHGRQSLEDPFEIDRKEEDFGRIRVKNEQAGTIVAVVLRLHHFAIVGIEIIDVAFRALLDETGSTIGHDAVPMRTLPIDLTFAAGER